ncbi:DUF2786 domain-containing protein [Leminorella grimontii]|uniref:DUF2786 domain-containing protein n=1 Tax=Leminorella grimontii TaxID=82981 RepID=UPI00322044C6
MNKEKYLQKIKKLLNLARRSTNPHEAANAISQAFGVRCYYSFRYTGYRGIPKRIVIFYGPAERPQIAAYTFDVLSRQMMAARREYIGTMRKNIKPETKTARADTFCESWVHGAYEVLQEFAVTQPEEALMEAYHARMTETGMKTGESRAAKKCRGADHAAVSGYASGLTAKLGHAIGGSSDVERIGRSS